MYLMYVFNVTIFYLLGVLLVRTWANLRGTCWKIGKNVPSKCTFLHLVLI